MSKEAALEEVRRNGAPRSRANAAAGGSGEGEGDDEGGRMEVGDDDREVGDEGQVVEGQGGEVEQDTKREASGDKGEGEAMVEGD